MCASTVEICYTAPLSYSLVTGKKAEKVSLIEIQNLGLLFNTLATNDKYPVLNRDHLTIPIQIQLSQKQKTFSDCFAAFLKSS